MSFLQDIHIPLSIISCPSCSPPPNACLSQIFTGALLPHLQWTQTGAFRYELELTPVSMPWRKNIPSAFLSASEYTLKLEIKYLKPSSKTEDISVSLTKRVS